MSKTIREQAAAWSASYAKRIACKVPEMYLRAAFKAGWSAARREAARKKREQAQKNLPTTF